MCGSENKQRLFPYTALTDWLYNRHRAGQLFDRQPVAAVCSTHSLHRHVRWYCSDSACSYQTAPCRISCVPCQAVLCSGDITNSSCCQMTANCVRYPISICSLHHIQMLPSDMSCNLWTIMPDLRSSWSHLWTVRTDFWKAALWLHRETDRCRDQVDSGVTHSQTNRTYEGWNFNSGNYLFTTDTK